MKLKQFRVQNFRSFADSGWVNCQDITALAGVNEAGKSNLLKALWKLKPAFAADNKILHNDLPRDKFEQLMDADELPVFIQAKFKLEPRDLGLLRKYFSTLKPFDICTVSRTLCGKYIVEVPVTVPEEQTQKLHNFIIKIMPGFIYYSNYGNLDSNIYLPQMLSKFNKSGVNALSSAKRRTIKLLLMYVGITPEMLKEDMALLFTESDAKDTLTAPQLSELLQKKERYQKLFDEAGKRLSAEFSELWRQGSYEFKFTFEGGNLKIWVTDSTGNSAPLEERSVGLQWFLSFFLVFSLESKLFYTNTALLLDESGMTLHSLAQQDLIAFLEKLAEKNQLLYSTHSSFMLPTAHLNRTKVVYKDATGHSAVTDDLRLNQEKSNLASLFPVQSAVGIGLSRSILDNSNSVIVMHQSEQFLLTAIKNILIGKGKLHTRNDIVFVSAGENGIDGTAQILSEGRDLPAVFFADDKRGQEARAKLLKGTYKDSVDRVFSVSQFGNYVTLEDCIPYEFFARGAGKYLAKILDQNFEIDTEFPFIKQVEEYAEKGKYVLPEDYRDEIAKRVKTFFNKNFDSIKIPRSVRKKWEVMITRIAQD